MTQAMLEEVMLQEQTKKSKVETRCFDFCRGMLAANIPLKKLENLVLRDVLESNLGIKLPSEATFRLKHMPNCFSEIMDSIRNDLKES